MVRLCMLAALLCFPALGRTESETPFSHDSAAQMSRAAQAELNRDFRRGYPVRAVAREFRSCMKLTLLRTTAVLLSDDDGSRALAKKKRGRIVPVEPWLRNPAIHKEANENYVRDWIATANLQLLMSGACFAFDIENLKYVMEKNTAENSRECWDDAAAGVKTTEWVQGRIDDATPGNAWHNAVILVFRWGKGQKPAGQACSGALSNHVLMAGNYAYQHAIDGKIKLGSSQLTHEFGHFMSLDHSHEGNMESLAGSAFSGNPTGLALTAANLPNMTGVTEADIVARRENFIDKLKKYPYLLDSDNRGNAETAVPDTYGISDTPADMGMGLPLLMGDTACEGDLSYTFTRYHPEDLVEERDAQGNFVWWKPVVFRVPRTYEETVIVDDAVRNNVMNYSICAPMLQRFSADQVKRMTWYLNAKRTYAVGRIVHSEASKWVKRPLLVRKYYPMPKPWPPGQLQKAIKRLARRGQLVIPSAGQQSCTEMELPG